MADAFEKNQAEPTNAYSDLTPAINKSIMQKSHGKACRGEHSLSSKYKMYTVCVCALVVIERISIRRSTLHNDVHT